MASRHFVQESNWPDAAVARAAQRALPIAVWLSIMAAVVIEAGALISAAALGDFSTFGPHLADLARIAVRATVVAGALGIGLLPAHPRWMPLTAAALGGILGPLACVLGRAAGAAVRSGLGLPPISHDAGVLMLLGFVRGAEFATLGFLAARLASRSAPVSSFAGAGAAVAVIFGVATVAVRMEAVFGALPTSRLVALTIEEIAFPIAIALALFAASRWGRPGERALRVAPARPPASPPS